MRDFVKDKIDWDINQWQEKENGNFKFNLNNITEKTYDLTAQLWSLVIANDGRGVEKNQLRNFYDKVLELYQKSINATDEEFKTKILPFVKMLNSKVVYASNKQQGSVNKAFVKFMLYALSQIDSKKSFENFKYLFESVIGFYQKGKYLKKDETRNKNNNRNHRGRR